MLRNMLWFLFFWLYMICSLVLYMPYLLLHLMGCTRRKRQYAHAIASRWARAMIWAAGGRVSVEGLEKIPAKARICYIANHQGNFDIPIILALLPGPIGFVSKRELLFFPIINLWMLAIGCVFINRKDRRGAVAVMEKGASRIGAGQAMLLFPEGTRSKGPKAGVFKKGSLKMPIRAGACIVPITISGSYRLREERGSIGPGSVRLTVHDPVDAKAYGENETGQLARYLEEVICQSL